ncbi:hypothetical protein, partial [Paracoccus kondratievae]|uniref:hypothetical protein n=1 Tax=Paracoccus kondratievae TaxID=135740 RepID=UPI0022F27B04
MGFIDAPQLQSAALTQAASEINLSGTLTERSAERVYSIICKMAARARCLIPRFDGAILSQEWKEALWARFVTE